MDIPAWLVQPLSAPTSQTFFKEHRILHTQFGIWPHNCGPFLHSTIMTSISLKHLYLLISTSISNNRITLCTFIWSFLRERKSILQESINRQETQGKVKEWLSGKIRRGSFPLCFQWSVQSLDHATSSSLELSYCWKTIYQAFSPSFILPS